MQAKAAKEEAQPKGRPFFLVDVSGGAVVNIDDRLLRGRLTEIVSGAYAANRAIG